MKFYLYYKGITTKENKNLLEPVTVDGKTFFRSLGLKPSELFPKNGGRQIARDYAWLLVAPPRDQGFFQNPQVVGFDFKW